MYWNQVFTSMMLVITEILTKTATTPPFFLLPFGNFVSDRAGTSLIWDLYKVLFYPIFYGSFFLFVWK